VLQNYPSFIPKEGVKDNMVSGVIHMLICKTHKSWENQMQQRRLSANPTPTTRKAKAVVTPGQYSCNCSRQERVKAKVQRLKSGPIKLRVNTPTEKHAGLEASRWQPHH